VSPESHHRLKWKCRRGLLELDLVLERLLQEDCLSEREIVSMHELLDLPDNDLWDIVCDRSEHYPAHLKDVVARLRAV
jgi:antitoxin CptB